MLSPCPSAFYETVTTLFLCVKIGRDRGQGCARLMNQRQHDSSYRPLAMDSSPRLPSSTNYTTPVQSYHTVTEVRTHYRQNRTTAYQRHSRSWQAASRAPSSPSLEMLDIRKLNARVQTLCVTKFASPLTLSRQPHQLHGRRKRGDGGRVPRSRKISGGRPLRNHDISPSFFLTQIFCFCIFHHFQNKVAEIRGETKFWE